jgi:hypothetical protein
MSGMPPPAPYTAAQQQGKQYTQRVSDSLHVTQKQTTGGSRPKKSSQPFVTWDQSVAHNTTLATLNQSVAHNTTQHWNQSLKNKPLAANQATTHFSG